MVKTRSTSVSVTCWQKYLLREVTVQFRFGWLLTRFQATWLMLHGFPFRYSDVQCQSSPLDSAKEVSGEVQRYVDTGTRGLLCIWAVWKILEGSLRCCFPFFPLNVETILKNVVSCFCTKECSTVKSNGGLALQIFDDSF